MKKMTPGSVLAPLTALAFGLILFACAPAVTNISVRNPDLFEKESDRLTMHGRAGGPVEAPEIFVRKRDIVMKLEEIPNETGSLFNPEDERNYLFTSSGPFNVGRFVDIKVASNRLDKKPEATKANAKDAAAEPALEDELLKALPDLTPAEKGDPSLIKNFKMKIVHRFENGDVLAMATRRSTVSGMGNESNVQARIPYDRLASGEPITTDDLLDIRYLDSRDGEVAERRSSGWEDEYSLRMSGFDEAKSKIAMEIEDKRKQVEDTRNKLETQIKTFGEERKQVAKQREDLLKKDGEQKEKVAGLEEKVKEQEQTIQEKEQEIKDLQPEEKPGDKKDGSNG